MLSTPSLRWFIALLVLFFATVPCRDSTSPPPPPAALSVVGSLELQGVVGQNVEPKPSVRVTDAMGRPIRGVRVTFSTTSQGSSISGATQLTDANGRATLGSWLLSVTTGPNTLSATVEGLPTLEFTADGLPDAAVALAFAHVPSELTENIPLAPAVRVELRDQHGNIASTTVAQVTLSLNLAPPSATINGTTTLTTTAGVALFSNVTVTAPNLATPVISGIEPAIITSGTLARITGQGFAPNVQQSTVSINGIETVINSGSGSELNVTAPILPVDCEPLRNVPLTVSVRSALFQVLLRASAPGFSNITSDFIAGMKWSTVQHPIRTAPQLALAVGQAEILSTAASARCFELPAAGDKYLINVFSANSSSVVSTPFTFRGKASQLPPSPSQVNAPAGERTTGRSPARLIYNQGGTRARATASDSAHARMLQLNRRILMQTRHPRVRAPIAGQSSQSALLHVPPPALAPASVGTVGSINPFRYSFESCGEGFATIMGRTVWVGEHAIIVEDVAPFGTFEPLNGTLDSYYAQLGSEFDALMWPLVLQHFGDPLLIDNQMAQHGKVIMLFTDRVSASGAQAFVFSCDFFPRTTFPKSNEAPIFYARVPTSLSGPPTNPNAPDGWYRVMRSTVIHEVKHIASYAERISESALEGFEESWLEEGGARIAEELYSRSFNSNTWKDNSAYLPTFICDLHPEQVGCINKPFVMAKHFGATISPPALYDYLDRSASSSVLCIDQLCADPSFYASAWSMIRWATDHFALTEASFLSQLAQNSQASGALNLINGTGLSWTTIMGEWTLMLAIDDLPGLLTTSPRLHLPSWNLRTTFAQLHADAPVKFQKAYPLTPEAVPFSDFEVVVPVLLSGGFASFELSGAHTGTQIIRIDGPLDAGVGVLPNPNLRIAIVRLQE